jgi:monothiol glutaredoxin
MSDAAVQDDIRSTVQSHDVVLFMKGTPVFPQCGFSSVVARVLDHLGVSYHSVNVLEDDAVRQGIKDFSDWPTIPQLYVKGEFVGGCDIVKEMFETGELRPYLAEKGVLAG